ncbi:tetratricopeptide repeat protein, partial [Yersinia intermedia]
SGTIKLSDSIVVRDFYYSLSAGLIDISKKDILIKVAEEFPKWSLVQFYAAKIYWQLGDMGKCELYLNKALKTQASLGRARLLLCQLLFDSDRYSDAEYHILILLEKNITFGI